MSDCFKELFVLLGRQMYDQIPTRKNFSFNNLFTPSSHPFIKPTFKKRPRRYTLTHYTPNTFQSVEDRKTGSLEVELLKAAPLKALKGLLMK